MKKILIVTLILIIVMQTSVFALNIFTVGKNFINSGASAGDVMEQTIEDENIVIPLVNLIFNIGVIVAVIIGIIIGIKLMTSGADGKAEMKAQLTPYIISVVVLVCSWTIWSIALNLLQGTFN